MHPKLNVADLIPPWPDTLPSRLLPFASRDGVQLSDNQLQRYSTQGIVRGDFSACFDFILVSPAIAHSCQRIEFSEPPLRDALLQTIGLRMLSRHEFTRTQERCLNESFELISRVEWAANSVRSLVRSIHIVASEADEFDVSSSDPDIPLSIFVSVPNQVCEVAILRVAESVLHEAMHLQLSLFEAAVTLLDSKKSDSLFYSPWRDCLRPPSGILHGLYVFQVISAFYKELLTMPHSSEADTFMKSRVATIQRDAAVVQAFRSHESLTAAGSTLVESLFC